MFTVKVFVNHDNKSANICIRPKPYGFKFSLPNEILDFICSKFGVQYFRKKIENVELRIQHKKYFLKKK